MEQNEFRIDKNKVLTKEYLLDQTNPGNAIPYVRNSHGTLMVDSNSNNIDTQRLVINLVNTRYKLLSFNNVLKTNFEEFLDPEITVPDEQQTGAQDQTGTILDLQNQVATKDQIIENLNQTIDNLSNTIAATNSGSVAEAIDVASIISQAINEATTQDNKKPRIFSDGTLIRDKNQDAFFYIIEDGKKRFFNFNEELLNITAKSLGKIKVVNGQEVPDLIDVSQEVIDDIPSGAPFLNFDLVKNVQTPAPPPLDLGGKRLVAKWIYLNGNLGKTPDNPIVLTVTNPIPGNLELEIPAQIQFATAEGIVNSIEVWDWPENTQWFNGKMSLPIRTGYSTKLNDYKQYTLMGRSEGSENVKIILKDTTAPLSPGTAGFGMNFVDRYKPIQLSLQNSEYDLVLTPKVLNDVDDVFHAVDERLYVRVKYRAVMPNVIDKSTTDARTILSNIGIPGPLVDINDNQGIRTNNSSLYYKISNQFPAQGMLIDMNTSISLKTYQPGNISFASLLIASNTKFVNVIRALKMRGFINFQVIDVRRSTFATDHTNVYKVSTPGYDNINLSFITQTYTVPWNDMFLIRLEIHNDSFSFKNNKWYRQLSDQDIINEFNDMIPLL